MEKPKEGKEFRVSADTSKLLRKRKKKSPKGIKVLKQKQAWGVAKGSSISWVVKLQGLLLYVAAPKPQKLAKMTF